eukprot:5491918-Lingulodinium_polyedra.AAC.1
MPRHAVPCHTASRHDMPCRAMPCFAVPRRAVPCRVAPCQSIQSVQCNSSTHVYQFTHITPSNSSQSVESNF